MPVTPDTLFQILSDTTRQRAVMLLLAEEELCVCELTHALQVSQPKISRHLAHLRESGLLRARRAGQWMYYRITPGLPDWVHGILVHAQRGNIDTVPYSADLARLHAMPDRPGAACCA